jgi:folate-dependent phosphoribosylglycinamide formyltransferase PurN
MIAAAICEENILAAGFLLDAGPVRLASRSQPPPLPRWRRMMLLFRLMVRFPKEYIPMLAEKLGFARRGFYQSLRKQEESIVDEVVRACGEPYRRTLLRSIQRFPTFREAAEQVGAPYYEVANINSDESAALLKSLAPDVIVSMGDRIFKPHTLAIPRLGVLNGHSSLLPGYRGTGTEFWQLFHREKETGITIHWMAQRVDEGEILVQERWPIHAGATHWQLRRVSQFLRIQAWRKATRLVLAGCRGSPQVLGDQPTFGQPHLPDLYNFYIRRQAGNVRDHANPG